MDNSKDNLLGKNLKEILDMNGYGFQYAIAKKINELSSKNPDQFPWRCEVSEFPVEVQNKNTHIDFVLKHNTQAFYLVCECKRVNPEIKNWIFLKVPFVNARGLGNNRIVRELIKFEHKRSILQDYYTNNIFRLSFEINCKGTKGHDEVNNAVTQVLRGMNGLIQYIMQYENNTFISLFKNKQLALMPIIFTTADLWETDIDLSNAELENGSIENCHLKLVDKQWLYYNYSQSPGLKHDFFVQRSYSDLSEALYHDFTRTIAIVNVKGIDNFLSQDIWEFDNDWR
jgi:hypothetical protein